LVDCWTKLKIDWQVVARNSWRMVDQAAQGELGMGQPGWPEIAGRWLTRYTRKGWERVNLGSQE
jgi:hypothetical protein